MFPYENVMSIHNQKMAHFISENERIKMARVRKAERPSALERRVEGIVESLRAFGQAFSQPGRFA